MTEVRMTEVRHQEQLTGIEKRVYESLPIGAANAIKVKDLALQLHVPWRRLYTILHALASRGYLVGSSRTKRGGVFKIQTSSEYWYNVRMLEKNANSYRERANGLRQHERRFE
ncbi:MULTISPECIES: hypothetical protein [Convivina]|uniref:Sugar-specific transcriptional regulator TrmB n=2 Tax=Convivina TaxID=1697027 RepID=A0A2U1D5Y3_9LACO|nr:MULTISPECIES: hypothetical protein [Convivina]SDB98146.1 hypothetical protein SAMN05216341_10841 [Leuconostocaceae bacterium R-53105]PVY83087.1 hypothetical protein C7384_10935 [Convivina intestini]CAH1849984.1 hypothetical protein R078138_00043 [Convivina sp. LMG 32447]CAH1856147.1 hypothetical protein LMG032447_01240 [Convivina sp. LMG 32447]CAH1856597.1 hypothetical protein R077811_01288 [Convivina intestini]